MQNKLKYNLKHISLIITMIVLVFSILTYGNSVKANTIFQNNATNSTTRLPSGLVISNDPRVTSTPEYQRFLRNTAQWQNKRKLTIHYTSTHFISDAPVSGTLVGLQWTADPTTKVATISGTQTSIVKDEPLGFVSVLPAYVTIIQLDNPILINGQYMFDGMKNITTVKGHADLSKTASLMDMFNDCISLVDIQGLATWDVSTIETMSALFSGCTKLANIWPLKTWHFVKMYMIMGIFDGDSALVDIGALAYWDVSKILYADVLLSNCDHLVDLSPIKNWNVSNMQDLGDFASGDAALRITPLESWKPSSDCFIQFMFAWSCVIMDVSGWPKDQLQNWKYLQPGSKITIGAHESWKWFSNDYSQQVIVKGDVDPFTYVPTASEVIPGDQIAMKPLDHVQTYTWCSINRKPITVSGFDGQKLTEFTQGVTLLTPQDTPVSWTDPDIVKQCDETTMGACDITYENNLIAHVFRSMHTDAYGNVIKDAQLKDRDTYATQSTGNDVITEMPIYNVSNLKPSLNIAMTGTTVPTGHLLVKPTNPDWTGDTGAYIEIWRPNIIGTSNKIRITTQLLCPTIPNTPMPVIPMTISATAVTAYDGTQHLNADSPYIQMSNSHHEIIELKDLTLHLSILPLQGVSYFTSMTFATDK